MAILKKRADYEEYRAEKEFGEEGAKRRRIKRLKPLPKDDKVPTGQRKRKRKEPQKPWGRKERLFVLIVLLLTVGASAILALSSYEWKLPGFPRIKISLPTFSFFGEETIVIEREVNQVNQEKAGKVTSAFKEKTDSLSGVYGLYFIELESGLGCGVNESDVFEPASLNKLPVMVAMYKEVESRRPGGASGPEGDSYLESKYKLKNEDKAIGAGSLDSKPEGYELTYRDLIKYMGKESDNTAFSIAKNILGKEKIEGAIDEIGMVNTVVFGEDQKTTPSDIGLFFQKLWEGEIISVAHRDELLDFLTDTVYEEWIVAGIPSDVKVAHKFGRELHIVNDAGIVFASGPEGRGPFVLVIMSKGIVEREADEIFPQLARAVYEIEAEAN